MSNLKIVFTKSKKRFPFGSLAIMKWTGKDYSHVSREVIRRDWGAAYYQSSDGNVNYEHETTFNKKHEIVKTYTLQIDEELEMKVREACWKECGKPYGTMQNIGIALVDIAAKLGIRMSNPFKSGQNCSEVIYRHALKVMYPELNLNPDTIKPHQIEDILIEKGYKPDSK